MSASSPKPVSAARTTVRRSPQNIHDPHKRPERPPRSPLKVDAALRGFIDDLWRQVETEGVAAAATLGFDTSVGLHALDKAVGLELAWWEQVRGYDFLDHPEGSEDPIWTRVIILVSLEILLNPAKIEETTPVEAVAELVDESLDQMRAALPCALCKPPADAAEWLQNRRLRKWTWVAAWIKKFENAREEISAEKEVA